MRWPLFLLVPACLLADKVDIPHEVPWFTGPLLATTAYITPLGHYDIEPYFFAIAYTGFYDQHGHAISSPTVWNNYFQPEIEVGIATNMDLEFLPTVYYNLSQGAANWALGDFPIIWDIGLYDQEFLQGDWATAIKLSLAETIPCGKYRNLKPPKNGTQIGGAGSWVTSATLTWGNLLRTNGSHYLNMRLNLGYAVPAPVHVKGFNFYGGGYGTNGTVYPGQIFDLDLGLEYSLTQNWVFALDVAANCTTRFRFKGSLGTITPGGPPAQIKNVATAQCSLAPAIEYNWSADIGLIAGSWFTIAGHNSLKFASFAIAFNYYH